MNLILDRKLLPTSITPLTSRVCRIRYSDSLSISTSDEKENKIEEILFRDEDGIVESLKTLATNHDADIFYVDIWIPVPILKVFYMYMHKREIIK